MLVESQRHFEPKRRFLLFSSIDTNRSAHDYWLAGGERKYDVVLYAYHGKSVQYTVDLFVEKKGFKFPAFYEFSQIADVSHYDAIWIVDDDIQMRVEEINKMFEIFEKYELWLGQPAFDNASKVSWEMMVVDKKYRLRYTNFVENGVVIFSREAIGLCLPVMSDIKTGFGSDFLFPTLIGHRPAKLAIIDEVVCHHPASTSSLDLLIPRSLHRADGERVMKKYRFGYFTPRVLGGVRRDRDR